MRIKQNNKEYRLYWTKSGSVDGNTPKYFYLRGIDNNTDKQVIDVPGNPLSSTKHGLVELARKFIKQSEAFLESIRMRGAK